MKYVYSADELIKTQPDRLEGLRFSKDDSTTIAMMAELEMKLKNKIKQS